MFKKIIVSAVALSALFVGLSSSSATSNVVEKNANADVIVRWGVAYGNLCCGNYGNVVCTIPWTPVGNDCGCFGVYGVGSVCPF